MKFKTDFIDIAYKILTRREGNAITDMDLYAISSIQRLIKLHEGFETLTQNQNYEAAIPLLRLMLDSCMRLIAIGAAANPQEVLKAFYEEKNIGKIKNKDGTFLSDGYLKEQVNKIEPGIKDTYDALSSYIHFSGTHFLSLKGQDEKICIGGNNLSQNERIVTSSNEVQHKILSLAIKILISYLL
jgi:hypothetical protein